MRTLVITGAGRGLGRELAVRSIQHGDRVVLIGRTRDPLLETIEIAGPSKVSPVIILSDLVNYLDFGNDLTSFLETEKVDVLINNAGVANFGPLMDTDLQDLYSIFSVNVFAAIALIKKCGQSLKITNGCVINILSDQIFIPSGLNVIYGASKAALAYATKSLAAEFANYKVRINAIAPGPMDTPLLRSLFGGSLPIPPLGKTMDFDDIWKLCCFLIECKNTTGSVMLVDGGTTLWK